MIDFLFILLEFLKKFNAILNYIYKIFKKVNLIPKKTFYTAI